MDTTISNSITGESSHIALSLISQFCDSRLKEMSTKCSAEKVPKIQHSFIYSDVLAPLPTSSSSAHDVDDHHDDGESPNYFSCGDPDNSQAYVRGLEDPESESQLCIKRKINYSRHIKPLSIKEWFQAEEPLKMCGPTRAKNVTNEHVINENGPLPSESNGERRGTFMDINALAKERLESYRPILKERINNGKWAKLKTIPNLKSLLLSSTSASSTSGNDLNEIREDDEVTRSRPTQEKADNHEQFDNACGCKWDTEQGFLFTSTNKGLFVCYGMIEKPHSVKAHRLNRMFDSIGVASIPLQSMMTPHHKQLYFVDGTARIKLHDLSGKLRFSQIVSGVMLAIIGRMSGIYLQIEDVVYSTPCAPEWPIPKLNNIEMVFISGLHLGTESGSNVALDLLQDYLLGLSGSAFEQKEVLAPRTRLFLVGNCIGKSMRIKSKVADHLEKTTEGQAKAMWKLESFLEPLVRTMEVFLIPGDNDLTCTSTSPQPPIHPKIFPETGGFSTMKRLTNPARIQVSVSNSEADSGDQQPNHESTFTPQSQSQQQSECSLLESSYAEFLKEGVHFIDMLFQSGRNIKETMDYCDITCPIEMGIKLLKWGHLHPTYCDTSLALARDLFRLKGSLPHVVAIGNLSEFKSVTWNNSRIVGIPAFHSSHTIVTLTKDFDVVPISFKLM